MVQNRLSLFFTILHSSEPVQTHHFAVDVGASSRLKGSNQSLKVIHVAAWIKSRERAISQ